MVIHTTIYSSGGSFREFVNIGAGKLYIVSAFSNVIIENGYVYTDPSGKTNSTKLSYSYSGTFRSDIATSLSTSAKNKFVSMGFTLGNSLYYRKYFSGSGTFSLY